MTTKYLLLTVLIIFTSFGTNAQTEYAIEKISTINLGDGRILFRDLTTEKPLQGEHKIISGYSSEYIQAGFKDGLYDGNYKYYKRNKLVEEKNYKEGIAHGKFIDYHLDGETKKSEREIVNGKIHGILRNYSQNGKIEVEQSFDNGVEHGKDKRYHYATGELIADRNYVNGKLDGKQTEFISSNIGDYKKISNYKMGVLEGEYSETTDDGIVLNKGIYKNGKKEGKWTTRGKDGIIDKEITYKDGKEDGEKRTYFTDGTLEEVAQFTNGKRNGLSKKYDFRSTKIKTEYTYKDGKKDGPYKLYTDQGVLREEGRYENDRDVYRKEYESDGKKVKSIRQRTRTGWEDVDK